MRLPIPDIPDIMEPMKISSCVALFSVVALQSAAVAQHTVRVSVGSDLTEGNGESRYPASSRDGRFVTFFSKADNLVPNDPGAGPDIFLSDIEGGTTECISLTLAGIPTSSVSEPSAVSDDGRYVAFASASSDLVVGDSNNATDVFVRDRLAGVTIRVSVSTSGIQANGVSLFSALSPNGRYIVFSSTATNLAPTATMNEYHVFVHDLQTGITEHVSRTIGDVPAGKASFGSSISADGRFVVFGSVGSVFVPGDTNRKSDVFVRDRTAGVTRRVSLTRYRTEANGESWGGLLSPDGRFLAYVSNATNILPTPGGYNYYCIFVVDLQHQDVYYGCQTESGGLPVFSSSLHGISDDGRYVLFSTDSYDVVSGDTNHERDVFLRDLVGATTVRMSVSTEGDELADGAEEGMICGDGSAALFVSQSKRAVRGDLNGERDVFLRRLGGLQLSASGFCTGPVTLDARSATPHGEVVFFSGLHTRDFLPAGRCGGVAIEIHSSRVPTVTIADASGAASVVLPPPVQGTMCLAWVQAVDARSCRVSNPVPVESPGPLSLSRSGPCSPGQQMTLGIEEALPWRTVVILIGNAGTSAIPGGRCSGTTLLLQAPTVLTVLVSDAQGVASFTFTPAPSQCGATLQAVEGGTCRVSNLVRLF